MIDHVSIGVSDLNSAAALYEPILSVLGYQKLADEPGTVGFGKKYPEFWLNLRHDLLRAERDNGTHICLRAASQEIVDEFYALSIQLGATANGAPGIRPQYHPRYYACFIKDTDRNHVEVVTFV